MKKVYSNIIVLYGEVYASSW